MEQAIFIVISFIVWLIITIHFIGKWIKEKSRADFLQKQIDGNLTDAEKLHVISEIYYSIDFKKVGNELLNDWENFLIKIQNET